MEEIRMKMVEKLNYLENYFVVDSMPLKVCKITRSSRSKICKEVDYALFKEVEKHQLSKKCWQVHTRSKQKNGYTSLKEHMPSHHRFVSEWSSEKFIT